MWIVTTPGATDKDPSSVYEVALPADAKKVDVLLEAASQHIASGAKVKFNSSADVAWRSDHVTHDMDHTSLATSSKYFLEVSEKPGVWTKWPNRSFGTLLGAELALEGVASAHKDKQFRIRQDYTTQEVVAVALNGKPYVHEPVKEEPAKATEAAKAPYPVKAPDQVAEKVAAKAPSK